MGSVLQTGRSLQQVVGSVLQTGHSLQQVVGSVLQTGHSLQHVTQSEPEPQPNSKYSREVVDEVIRQRTTSDQCTEVDIV